MTDIPLIHDTCTPREDLLRGTFNPEVFTAHLTNVVDKYRDKDVSENVYTDAQAFFEEATYPTQGLKSVLASIFGRLSGDGTYPAIQRLETAFGGGKTHALIAATHIAHQGTELSGLTDALVDPEHLPDPDSVAVVGIAGDELPVQKPKGEKLVPHTLWGEIAHQVGGEELYRHVQEDAESDAAPGRHFLETVFGGRKVLVMLDELAQYAARVEMARRGGAGQLAAFLMTLHGYAREHTGISVVLTLASQADAFSRETERLATLLSDVAGEEVSEEEAVSLGEQALEDVTSVAARDATSIVPVQAREIASVLAQRLFTEIDEGAASQVADAYAEMYDRNRSLLPEAATRHDTKDRIAANYPFHPALLGFLNAKLATAESFQGTRGVLRMLALTVRNIFADRSDASVPALHPCHISLRDEQIVNELINRTQSADLLPIINADVGGVDTGQLEGGLSNAQMADERNPHPESLPMYEFTWRTVFLHSLVGRQSGLESNLFGVGERDALWQTSFPGLTPPQVREALTEIKDRAYYLRERDGRYFASLDPSVNKALGNIRRSLDKDRIDQLLAATARKVVKDDPGTFEVVHDVTEPEHVPDTTGVPVLALVALEAGKISVEEFVTYSGPGRPRKEQNHVFLLVPDTVIAEEAIDGQSELFETAADRSEEVRQRLQDQARWVLAMRLLRDRPQEYGINPERLEEREFESRHKEREQALITTVTEAYSSLWFPSAKGEITREDVKTAGGEGGLPTIERVHQVLLDEGELVTETHTGRSQLSSLAELIFERSDTIAYEKLRENFARVRRWPILERPELLERLVREGVRKGVWCLFRMGSSDRTTPEEIYHQDQELPFDLDIAEGDYSLITLQGAKKRDWLEAEGPSQDEVAEWVYRVLEEEQAVPVARVAETVREQYGDVPQREVEDALVELVRRGRLCAYEGESDQDDPPDDLLTGTRATLFTPRDDTVAITKAEAARRGWMEERSDRLELEGREAMELLFPLLSRLGSLYNRGATTPVEAMDLLDLSLPHGGRLRVSLEDVPPESMQLLDELFQDVANVAEPGDRGEAFLTLTDPDDECPFVKELRSLLEQDGKDAE